MKIDNILRKFSSIDNLKSTFIFRFIIGFIFVIYGFLIFYFTNIEDIWVKISIALAFWSLGLMFILDSQSILMEYFRDYQGNKAKGQETETLLSFFMALFFIIGTILLFVKFNQVENPSFYPIVIYLIAIILILIFQRKISHFELSKDKLIVKMKEDQERDYESIESKKQEWNFEVKEV